MDELVAGREYGREESEQATLGAARDDHLVWRERMPFHAVALRQNLAQRWQAILWRIVERW
jgi:hypothetical protein